MADKRYAPPAVAPPLAFAAKGTTAAIGAAKGRRNEPNIKRRLASSFEVRIAAFLATLGTDTVVGTRAKEVESITTRKKAFENMAIR